MAYPVGLRTEHAELAGSCAAQHYQVVFSYCRRLEGRLVARIVPIPPSYECPITGDWMQDPVMLCDGHVYDRPAIEHWFAHGRQTSPLTNLEVPSLACMPLLPLRKAIETFLNGRPEVLGLRAGELAKLESTVSGLRAELGEARVALEASRGAAADLEQRLREEEKETQQVEQSSSTAAKVASVVQEEYRLQESSHQQFEVVAKLAPSKRLQAAVQKVLTAIVAKAPTDGKKKVAKHELSEEAKHELASELATCAQAFEKEASEFNEVAKLACELMGVPLEKLAVVKEKLPAGSDKQRPTRKSIIADAPSRLSMRLSSSPAVLSQRFSPKPAAVAARAAASSARSTAPAPPASSMRSSAAARLAKGPRTSVPTLQRPALQQLECSPIVHGCSSGASSNSSNNNSSSNCAAASSSSCIGISSSIGSSSSSICRSSIRSHGGDLPTISDSSEAEQVCLKVCPGDSHLDRSIRLLACRRALPSQHSMGGA